MTHFGFLETLANSFVEPMKHHHVPITFSPTVLYPPMVLPQSARIEERQMHISAPSNTISSPSSSRDSFSAMSTPTRSAFEHREQPVPPQEQSSNGSCSGPRVQLHLVNREKTVVPPDVFSPSAQFSTRQPRAPSSLAKGLRQFSAKVLERVKAKGLTTHNEVADELVNEFFGEMEQNGTPLSDDQRRYDQKNIRRRVYDAINVLMAMGIIAKERKDIKWVGLPQEPATMQQASNSGRLKKEKAECVERLAEKEKRLKELVRQHKAFQKLIARNAILEGNHAFDGKTKANSIQLPLVCLMTNKNTVVDGKISSDKREYLFDFSERFQVLEDVDILQKLGFFTPGFDKDELSSEELECIKGYLSQSQAAYPAEAVR